MIFRLLRMATLLFVLTTILSIPLTAMAQGTDPSGMALKRYVEEYLKNAMPHDALASKIKAMGGADSFGVYEWLCSLEVSNTLSVGYNVWESRMQADEYFLSTYTKSQFIPLNITNYCIRYSNACGHWQWNADCLRNK